MKTLLLAMIAILGITNLNAQNTEKLLAKKWEVTKIYNPAMGKLPLPPDGIMYFNFNTDKTYEIGVGIEEEKGRWSYDAQKKTISLEPSDDAAASTMKLISVKKNTLVMETEENEIIMQITLKPKK